VGNSGSIRDHCSSENQKKSAIANTSLAEALNHTSPAMGIRLLGPDPREIKDPTDVTKSYTTTAFDMWRFVDGKADEHWDGATRP
jgi:hypothetical protein